MELPLQEVFTKYSSKYAPAGFTPESLGAECKKLVDKSEVLRGVVARVVDADPKIGPWLWTARHIEHAACECRKCQDGSGNKRVKKHIAEHCPACRLMAKN